jgi:hypothetical protein
MPYAFACSLTIVTTLNGRSLREHRYPFGLVDALVLRICEDERVRRRAVMITTQAVYTTEIWYTLEIECHRVLQ